MTSQSGQLAPPIIIGERSERPPGGIFTIIIAVALYRNALRDSKYTTPKFHTASLAMARILAARIYSPLDRSRSPKMLASSIDTLVSLHSDSLSRQSTLNEFFARV